MLFKKKMALWLDVLLSNETTKCPDAFLFGPLYKYTSQILEEIHYKTVFEDLCTSKTQSY